MKMNTKTSKKTNQKTNTNMMVKCYPVCGIFTELANWANSVSKSQSLCVVCAITCNLCPQGLLPLASLSWNGGFVPPRGFFLKIKHSFVCL